MSVTRPRCTVEGIYCAAKEAIKTATDRNARWAIDPKIRAYRAAQGFCISIETAGFYREKPVHRRLIFMTLASVRETAIHRVLS